MAARHFSVRIGTAGLAPACAVYWWLRLCLLSYVQVRGDDDTSNFDDYPDSDTDSALPLSSKDRARFAEFDTF